MAAPPPSFAEGGFPALARRLRDARRGRGLTQADLARQVGCRQSAVSMMERGRSDALSRENLGRLAALLGVTLDVGADGNGAAPAGRAYCPQAGCPANVPYAVEGEVLFWPSGPQPAPGARCCAHCGEVLARNCPSCGAPASAGACCTACGAPYVAAPPEAAGSAESWSETRRKDIAEWRGLTR
jgi:transcriptional regulator with XRE-family HTH domain